VTSFSLQSVAVLTESEDEDGVLVRVDDRLVAVLVRLSAPYHGGIKGHWFLEAGFGRCGTVAMESFVSLEAALRWIAARFDSRESGGPDDLAALAATFTPYWANPEYQPGPRPISEICRP
jgi:hypothetical protein